MTGLRVRLERVDLPGSEHVSPTDGGTSKYGNNDRGRRLQANRARTTWRIVRLDGGKTGSGLFVDREHAMDYATARGWLPVDGELT